MTISERLFYLLDKQEKYASDLCKILHIGTSTTTNWKNRNTDPPAKFIMQISEFLNVSPEFLLTGDESTSTVSSDELELLRMYRYLPEAQQEFISDSVKAAYEKEIQRQEATSRLLG